MASWICLRPPDGSKHRAQQDRDLSVQVTGKCKKFFCLRLPGKSLGLCSLAVMVRPTSQRNHNASNLQSLSSSSQHQRSVDYPLYDDAKLHLSLDHRHREPATPKPTQFAVVCSCCTMLRKLRSALSSNTVAQHALCCLVSMSLLSGGTLETQRCLPPKLAPRS